MGTLVRSYFAFGSHANISPLRFGSPLYSTSMTLSKSFILLLNFMLAISLGLPCICQVVIALSWALLAFLSLMSASLTFIISHISQACLMSSQVEPLYILYSLIPIFSPGGDIPSSVVILHMFPCIKHRYVPLLGTSLFPPWHLSPPRCIALLFFFKLFKISKKSSKKQKSKKPNRKRRYLSQQLSHEAFNQSTVYHIRWLG